MENSNKNEKVGAILYLNNQMTNTPTNKILPFFLVFFAIFSGFLNYKAANFTNDQHFSSLAHSFINNDLFLSPFNLPSGDYADYMAKQYLFYGPMPSIMLAPFVFVFGKDFPQMSLSLTAIFVTYISIFFLSTKLKFNKLDSLMLANFFVFSTVFYFLALVNISAYLVQVVGITFIILALLEYFTKKRWFLIGILIASAGLTRLTLYASVIFFLIDLIKNKGKIRRREILLFFIPIVFSLLIIGLYNNRRFNSPFETGYKYNITLKNYPLNTNLEYGIFSIKHVPANLYNLIWKSPDPIKAEGSAFILDFPYLKADGWGLAIWFTSPLFAYLIRVKKNMFTTPSLITILALFIPSAIYFGLGFSQFGYRYSLDFLPFLFLILISTFSKRLPAFAKFLIILGVVFNCLYMLSIWDSYPVFEFFGLLPKVN